MNKNILYKQPIKPNETEFKNYVVDDLVQPFYVHTLKDQLAWGTRWKKICDILYSFSKLLHLTAAILAYCESYFKVGYLALLSGSISLTSILILQYGDYSNKKSVQNINDANIFLKSLGISEIPIVKNKNTDDSVETKDTIERQNNETVIDINSIPENDKK